MGVPVILLVAVLGVATGGLASEVQRLSSLALACRRSLQLFTLLNHAFSPAVQGRDLLPGEEVLHGRHLAQVSGYQACTAACHGTRGSP